MKKNDPIENALDRLGELRHTEPSDAVVEELRKFLGHRSNLVVAKAAKVVCAMRAGALVGDLVRAFQRFMKDAPKLDKRCVAVTEVASTLYELDYGEPEVFLWGLRHVQMEGSFGPPVDEAAKLRGICAQGVMRTRYRDAAAEVVRLLVDREAAARLGAVRALATNGGEAGALLLRLKVLAGDTEAEVLAECFSGLLATGPAVGFVGEYMDSADDAVAEAAMLALGESRLPEAYALLREKWERTLRAEVRSVLLVAMATSRLDEAVEFLVSLVETANIQTAESALEALAIYRSSGRVKTRLEQAVFERGDSTLRERFQVDFE